MHSSEEMEHRFHIAFSFAGPHREKVRSIAELVARMLGREKVFFDEWFEHEILGADMDVLLQSIYHEQSLMVVADLSENYADREWTQAEGRAIRALRKKLDTARDETARLRLLNLRLGTGHVPGVLGTEGYLDGITKSAEYCADLILKRHALLVRRMAGESIQEAPTVEIREQKSPTIPGDMAPCPPAKDLTTAERSLNLPYQEPTRDVSAILEPSGRPERTSRTEFKHLGNSRKCPKSTVLFTVGTLLAIIASIVWYSFFVHTQITTSMKHEQDNGTMRTPIPRLVTLPPRSDLPSPVQSIPKTNPAPSGESYPEKPTAVFSVVADRPFWHAAPVKVSEDEKVLIKAKGFWINGNNAAGIPTRTPAVPVYGVLSTPQRYVACPLKEFALAARVGNGPPLQFQSDGQANENGDNGLLEIPSPGSGWLFFVINDGVRDDKLADKIRSVLDNDLGRSTAKVAELLNGDIGGYADNSGTLTVEIFVTKK
jgi:hypothetical protein